MKKFSKIIAGISAISVCLSSMCFNASAYYDKEFDFSGHKGDVNSDGIINAVDASLVLSYYAYISSTPDPDYESFGFSEEQYLLADVNNDEWVDAIDATIIMDAYADLSTGNEFLYEGQGSLSLGNCSGTPDNGFSDTEISKSTVKPCITVETRTLSYEEACMLAANGDTIPVRIWVDGAENKYSSTGLHVHHYPSYSGGLLSIPRNKIDKPDVESGEAIKHLSSYCNYDFYRGSSIFLATTGSKDAGMDGTMYTINFELPAHFEPGDFFPVRIEYQSSGNVSDLFTNNTDDETGKLMQAYLFTQGITNGGIQIEEAPVTTTTTTTTTSTTTTTTTATTTTGKVSGTVKTGDANGDGKINIADAVAIMQALSNPGEFSLTKECAEAADIVDKGNGLTSMDALALQMIDINLLSLEDLPITSEALQELIK